MYKIHLTKMELVCHRLNYLMNSVPVLIDMAAFISTHSHSW